MQHDIFHEAGKRMPYSAPDDAFFKRLQDSVMDAVKDEPAPHVTVETVEKVQNVSVGEEHHDMVKVRHGGVWKTGRYWIGGLVAAAIAALFVFVMPNMLPTGVGDGGRTADVAGVQQTASLQGADSTAGVVAAVAADAAADDGVAAGSDGHLSTKDVDKAFAQLSTADQEYLIDLYEAQEVISSDYYD